MERTLFKGMQLLETIAVSSEPRRISDLARELGLQPSNVHRLLKTLTSLHYVQQHGTRGGYSATPRLFEMGMAVGDRIDVRTVSKPLLRQLAERSGEAVGLSILNEGAPLMIERVDLRGHAKAYTLMGLRTPANCTSAGLVLLAFASAEVVAKAMKDPVRYSSKTVTSAHKLRERLETIRRAGYVIVRDEWQPGLGGIAAPVLRGGQAVAAINISGATERLTQEVLEGFVPMLRDGTQKIAALLGERGPVLCGPVLY
jgi:DNA-binding IclR family transcriptional regulator